MPDIPTSSSVGWLPGRYYATGRCLWERVKVKEHRVHSVGTCSEGLWDRWRPSWPRPVSGRCSLQGQTLTNARYTALLAIILLSHPRNALSCVWLWHSCKVCISLQQSTRDINYKELTKLTKIISWLGILWPPIRLIFYPPQQKRESENIFKCSVGISQIE